jgi:hypothetical protein
MKLNKIENEKENQRIRQYMRGGRRIVLLPAVEKPRMTREEFKAWRSDRSPDGSQTRWRNGTLKKADGVRGSFGPVPAINKTVIEKPKRVAQTPERYPFAPKHIRDMIK